MRTFVLVDNGATYRTGRIIEAVAAEYFLIEFDNMHDKTKTLPAEMVHLSEMAEFDDEFKAWHFFATAELRQEWLDEIDSPVEPRVVNFVKK